MLKKLKSYEHAKRNREAAEMSVRGAAEKLGVSHPQLLRYEKGEHPIPYPIAKLMADEYGGDFETYLGERYRG